MSAFRCHCGTILPVLLTKREGQEPAVILAEYNEIVKENTNSLIARYGVDHGFEDAEELTEKDITQWMFSPEKKVSVVQAIKFAHCIDYQSCEHDGWEKSRAYAIIQDRIDFLINRLPGYDEAEWDASNDEIPNTNIIKLM